MTFILVDGNIQNRVLYNVRYALLDLIRQSVDSLSGSLDRSARQDGYGAVGADGLSGIKVLVPVDLDLDDVLNAKPIGSARFGAQSTYDFFSELFDCPACCWTSPVGKKATLPSGRTGCVVSRSG